MPESSSPRVRRREKADRSTQSALSTTRELMAAELTAFFAPHVREGETPIDFGYLWDLLGRAVGGVETLIVDRDQVHLGNRALVTQRRKQQRRQTSSTRDQLINLRKNIEAGYGSDADERAGYAGSVPDEAIAVLRLGKTVAGNVEDFESLGLTPLENSSGEIPERAVTNLRERVTGLEESVTGLTDAERAAEQSQLQREDALDVHDRVYGGVGQVAEGFCRLVGQDERASRMRTSYQRTSRRKPDPGDAKTGDEAPATPSEPAPTP